MIDLQVHELQRSAAVATRVMVNAVEMRGVSKVYRRGRESDAEDHVHHR